MSRNNLDEEFMRACSHANYHKLKNILEHHASEISMNNVQVKFNQICIQGNIMIVTLLIKYFKDSLDNITLNWTLRSVNMFNPNPQPIIKLLLEHFADKLVPVEIMQLNDFELAQLRTGSRNINRLLETIIEKKDWCAFECLINQNNNVDISLINRAACVTNNLSLVDPFPVKEISLDIAPLRFRQI